MSDARRRVIRAAMTCFGQKGYAATTIADIERAAGLTVGAGGTYRHFPSKRAILEAVIDTIVSAPDDVLAPPSPDIEATAHESLDYMNAELVRFFFRDLDAHPDQRDRIVDRLVTGPYRIVAARIAETNPTIDAKGAAAVLLGSLINFRVIEVLIGEGRNGVSRSRFIKTWSDTYRLVANTPRPSHTARRPARKRPIN